MRYYVCEEAVCKDSFAYLHCMGVRPRLARLLRAVFERQACAAYGQPVLEEGYRGKSEA